ncbi:MAG: flavodoxin domain-containing protein [Clostridia bacterium]
MIKAIVYNSNTGFTKKYADMLSEKLGIPCYEGEKAHYVLVATDEIIFMSWISANRLKGYTHIRRSYKIKAICAVGLGEESEMTRNKIIENNKIKESIPFFYLRGGMDKTKLTGFNKFAINIIEKIVEKSNKKESKDDNGMHNDIREGADYVDENNLNIILTWFEANNN